MRYAYKLLDFGGLDHPALETALNRFGAEGWELVAMLSPQTGVLKRADVTQAVEKELIHPASVKYRDPETGNTWSGRGRMPNWLAARIKSGARLEDFLA